MQMSSLTKLDLTTTHSRGLFIPGVYSYPVILFVDYLGIDEKMCNLLKEHAHVNTKTAHKIAYF